MMLLVPLAMLWAPAACDRHSAPIPEAPPGGAGAPRSGVIVFMGAGEGDPLWAPLSAGARRADAGLARCELQFVNPTGRSPQDQINCLRALNVPDMRGLCIQIIDAEAVGPLLGQLHHRGIRIVSMIRAAPWELVVGHAGYDDRAIGAALADAANQALGSAGTLALLHAGSSDAATRRRRAGFEETIRSYRDIIMFTDKDCGGDPRQARQIIRAYSERFPRLSAWVALEDWPLRERGLEALSFPPGCRLITFGGTPEHWPLVEDGTIAALVAADYGQLGAQAVKFCEAAIREPPRRENLYTTPLRIIWPTNLDAYRRDWAYWSSGEYAEGEQAR